MHRLLRPLQLASGHDPCLQVRTGWPNPSQISAHHTHKNETSRVPVSGRRGQPRRVHALQPARIAPISTTRMVVSPSSITDHSSFANLGEARVTHSDIDLGVHFDSKTIDGYIELTLEAVADGADKLVLDTSKLSIQSASFVAGSDGSADGGDLPFTLDDPYKALGSKLTITLPNPLTKGDTACVAIRFQTSPESSALQFLEPSQTAGKQHPYLFTQCQAIHARAFVPCQDTPAVKSTYTAAVRVPKPVTALMSAVALGEAAAGDDKLRLPAPAASGTTRMFRFRQDVPIPSYLLALAVGELEGRRIGPVSHVWSEPSMVDAAAFEFANTADYLAKGEQVAGEYVWGQYDLLLLPPSFPYGGMENPCLTFVTPTLLAGDRSLDRVIAHEIAHSWFGNLVTNATWESFWLNEGFTVFLERKIIGRIAGEAALQFAAESGRVQLVDAVRSFGDDHPFTALVPDLSGGIDPDDAFSRIPYEKGFYFLYYLQELVGGPPVFEPFMRAYIDRFRLRSLSSEDFKAFFVEHFADNAAIVGIDWDIWLYAPGLPPAENRYDTSLGDAALALAKKWHTSDVMGIGGNGPPDASSGDLQGWGTEQVVLFLDKLGEYRAMQALHKRITRRMAELYKLDGSRNAEVRCSWYKLCIDAGDEAVFPGVVEFLNEQGRMKYLRPLYRALFRSPDQGRRLALETFAAARTLYHPIAAKMVAADLGLPQNE